MSTSPDTLAADVIVIGTGNAAFSAALSARDRGRKVLMLEAAAFGRHGGNSFFTAGATRITHDGLDSLRDLIEPDDRHAVTEVPPYTAENYLGDLAKVTEGENDPELSRVLVENVSDTIRWLKNEHNLKYRLMYERQAYERADGTYLFWGGLHVGNVGGGEGMIAAYVAEAARVGIEIRYEHRVLDFVVEEGTVVGVTVQTPEGEQELRAESVVIGAGGFESSAEMREKHLGTGWGNAIVRGTPENTGALLDRAIAIGAATAGGWSTCHSTAWDAWYPENASNIELTNRLTRQSYPLGVVVNLDGERFVDEGADFRNYTYAKYGREILKQRDSIAFQLFDATTRTMLRTEEYDMPGVSVRTADTIEELAVQIGANPENLAKTIAEFNASIATDVPFDPTVLDGRRADVTPPKSNWALALETAPFSAYPVTCGITFTFGGLKGDTEGRVLREDGTAIPGLLVCGEALGGLFAHNYPGGSGLAAGMVFGRRAGAIA